MERLQESGDMPDTGISALDESADSVGRFSAAFDLTTSAPASLTNREAFRTASMGLD